VLFTLCTISISCRVLTNIKGEMVMVTVDIIIGMCVCNSFIKCQLMPVVYSKFCFSVHFVVAVVVGKFIFLSN
jgi:hypothetical protein